MVLGGCDKSLRVWVIQTMTERDRELGWWKQTTTRVDDNIN